MPAHLPASLEQYRRAAAALLLLAALSPDQEHSQTQIKPNMRAEAAQQQLTLLAASSPLIGITALMPPMAKQPRLWHVFTTSCSIGEGGAGRGGAV